MDFAKTAHVAVPVCVCRTAELPGACERAAALADFVELRLDCLEVGEFDATVGALPSLLKNLKGGVIMTLRPSEQGGRRTLDLDERLSFWSAFFSRPQPPNVFADIELDLMPHLRERAEAVTLHVDWSRVICSQHDFTGVPAALEQLYEKLATTPAGVLKIAMNTHDATDCLPIFRLLERARREGRALIAVAMGEAGLATRIIGPARGAFLTFGALDTAHATAPGQLTAAELRDLYRLDALDAETEIMGLAGAPVAHSFSPHLHNAAFAAINRNAVYMPFEVLDLSQFVRRMIHPRTRELRWNVRGLSVTAPHKSAIMESLDFIDDAAREIGAVNTVLVKDDALHGSNTDGEAALAPLGNLLELRGARVAVIGAGGAARAVLWSLRRDGANTTVFARRPAVAQVCAQQFDARAAALAGAHFGGFDLVINTTPLGTRGALEGDAPAAHEQLRGARAAYDLVYNPSETRFMREARQADCEIVVGGLSMLVAQAAAQFELWTGQAAPLAVMRAAAEQQLAKT